MCMVKDQAVCIFEVFTVLVFMKWSLIYDNLYVREVAS